LKTADSVFKAELTPSERQQFAVEVEGAVCRGPKVQIEERDEDGKHTGKTVLKRSPLSVYFRFSLIDSNCQNAVAVVTRLFPYPDESVTGDLINAFGRFVETVKRGPSPPPEDVNDYSFLRDFN